MIQKGREFVHYVPTVIERSKSITTQYLRRVIPYSGQFLNITKFWCLSVPYFLLLMSLTPNLVEKGPNSNITYKNANKRIKVTIYINFEVNMLTSNYMFHKFCNFNPSSGRCYCWNCVTYCVSCEKWDRRIEVIPKRNQTNISNIICGIKIKTRSIFTNVK